MPLTLKPGMRLYGAACTTEAIVVKTPVGELDVQIGGHPALTDVAGRSSDLAVAGGHDMPTLMGKRYVNADGSLELLCTKPGAGSLAVGDALCEIKDAKPLPASD